MILTDLRKQQAIYADSKAMQQSNFIENLNWYEDGNDNRTMFLKSF